VTIQVDTAAPPDVAGNVISGHVEKISLESEPVRAETRDAGRVSASYQADLNSLPAPGSAVVSSIAEEITPDAARAFDTALASEGLAVRDIAYTLQVEKSQIQDEKDIGAAKVTMAVGSDWVMKNGGPDQVQIVRWADDLSSQALPTVLKGSDESGNMVFEARSPRGLSIFALIAVKPSQEVFIENSRGEGTVLVQDSFTRVSEWVRGVVDIFFNPRLAR
jgi:hypothetical protein